MLPRSPPAAPSLLSQIALGAIAACHARPCTSAAVTALGGQSPARVHLFGAGKAAWAMAAGLVDAIGPRPVTGLVVVKHPPGAPELGGMRWLRAGHPEPDERSAAAARQLRSALAALGAQERAFVVLSGGASSLLAEPAPGLSLAQLAQATRALLAGGVPIAELNVVRKHLTRASGGRLAVATRASVEVLVLSDVLGDDWSTIGSGPLAPDPSTFAQALAIARAVPSFPDAALIELERGAAGELGETPKPGDRCFDRVRHHLVASAATLVAHAVRLARERGGRVVRTLPLAGADVSALVERLVGELHRMAPGELCVTGGEPTVCLPPRPGRGGRSQQLALLMARALAVPGVPAARMLALGSDGEDGPTDAAGAEVSSGSWEELRRAGLDPKRALAQADAYPLLDAAGLLVRSGPTDTNVLDLHLLERMAC